MVTITATPIASIEVARVRRVGGSAWLFDSLERDTLGESYRRCIALIDDDELATQHANELRSLGYSVRWDARP